MEMKTAAAADTLSFVTKPNPFLVSETSETDQGFRTSLVAAPAPVAVKAKAGRKSKAKAAAVAAADIFLADAAAAALENAHLGPDGEMSQEMHDENA